ncbi:hypothetical protein RJ639_010530 [Escallonia herrerae]|uniref:Transcriptional coactivator Hfi1/Transcriptional adapter 1 n=1 Tax=Escallonia herrerae TaxID=1293975 RepID=A0AA88VR34_9ASTE|nr:hypothetical protein RJ639_010530 [Escallonia herrerae]
MQPPHQHSRINLAEVKAEIVRKLGPERSKQYFSYLSGLLSLKLSKIEFNKLCLRIVGRENIPLHNQFVCSILKNACTAKIPPPTYDVEVIKPTKVDGIKEPPADGYLQNGSHPTITQALNQSALSNGGILPLSPRKARTGNRDRRVGDRRKALEPNGKTNLISRQSSIAISGDYNVISENGHLSAPDIRRPLQHHQGIVQPLENEGEVSCHHPAKLSAIKRSPDGPASVHNKDKLDLLVKDNGMEDFSRGILRAPLGIPCCPGSIGGARRAVPLANGSEGVSMFNNGVLLDTVTLRERVEQIAATQGLQGVSMDCAKVLNSGLDAYLKSLIKSCVELAAVQSGHGQIKNSIHNLKLLNGVRPGHHYQIQSSSLALEVMQEHRPHCPISLLDFRVAMELNPQQLGEDWPLLLEKICTHTYEE